MRSLKLKRRKYAVKQLLKKATGSEGSIPKLNEVQILSQLQQMPDFHSCFCQLRGVIRRNESIFLMFDFMETTLQAMIESHKSKADPIPISSVCSLSFVLSSSLFLCRNFHPEAISRCKWRTSFQLLHGCEVLHRNGIMHRG